VAHLATGDLLETTLAELVRTGLHDLQGERGEAEEGGEGGIRKGKDLKNAKRVFQKTYIYLLFYVPLPLLCQVLDLRLKRDDFAVLDKEVEAKMEIAKLFDLHNYTKKVV
jgi:hypothetical protein